MRIRTRYVVLLPALALAACGTATAPTDGVSPSAGTSGGGSTGSTGRDEGQVYTGTGTVLESAEHGPQLCLGGVAESLPPQCGGPDIAGWSWDDVEGAESANGTTWGTYTVVGTYDGSVFSLTEPATAPESSPDGGSQDEDPFATPCPPPEGGWSVVDPATATDDALSAASELAAAADGYAGLWVDQPTPTSEAEANDPTELVLNVRTTGDVGALESDLRTVWGGALCVSPALHTEAELLQILDAVMTEPGALGGGPDVVTGTVRVQVIVDDGVQERMDETYGEGVVVVESALRPVD